jgi:hypothetical protein
MNSREHNNSKAESGEQRKAAPFFAKYLEGQNRFTVKTNLKAGKAREVPVTQKYPSDSDESSPASDL